MLRSRARRILCLAAIFTGLSLGLPAACAGTGGASAAPAPAPASESGDSRASIRSQREPAPPRDFRRAKHLMREIYAGLEVSFYCGCRYVNGGGPDASSCGYRPARADKRSRRIEWEHVVPAAWLGRERECWNRPAACRRKNGKDRPRRACCRRIDPEYRTMEGDPHNLVPAVGELNARRLDFPFGEISGEARIFGACDFEIGTADDSQAAFGRSRGLVEPRPEIRGDIARIHFYMIDQYGVPIETNYLKMLQEWARLDPVSPVERLRNERIRERTGLNNPFVSDELN